MSAKKRSQIYIPLCLYFNKDAELLKRSIDSIYIPLCLYFNFSRVCSVFLKKSNLHSIMSLF